MWNVTEVRNREKHFSLISCGTQCEKGNVKNRGKKEWDWSFDGGAICKALQLISRHHSATISIDAEYCADKSPFAPRILSREFYRLFVCRRWNGEMNPWTTRSLVLANLPNWFSRVPHGKFSGKRFRDFSRKNPIVDPFTVSRNEKRQEREIARSYEIRISEINLRSSYFVLNNNNKTKTKKNKIQFS